MNKNMKLIKYLAIYLAIAAAFYSRGSELLSSVSGTIAYGQNTASGNNVYALAISTPISQNFAVSLIGANDGGRWLASAATVQLGDKWAVSDRISLTANAGSGIAYDIFTQRPTIYSFVDGGADYRLTKSVSIGGKVVIANLADRAGIDVLGALSIGYKF